MDTRKSTHLPAVWYLRVSSEQQSMDYQLKALRAISERWGVDESDVEILIDDGIAGDYSGDNRPAYQRLLQLISESRIRSVFAYDVDRISRAHPADSGEMFEALKESGVLLIDGNHKYDLKNNDNDYLMLNITQLGKHQWLVGHAKRAAEGMLGGAEKGPIGPQPYAIDRVFYDSAGIEQKRVLWNESGRGLLKWRCRWEPSKDQVAVDAIVWMFETFRDANGAIGYTELANEKGLPTRTGGEWIYQTIRRILTNPAYIGVYQFGKTSYGKYYRLSNDGQAEKIVKPKGLDRQQRQRPFHQKRDKPVVRREDSHEAIVDMETWLAVQAIAKRIAKQNRKPRCRSEYLLSNIAICGDCGSNLHGATNKRLIRYLRCQNPDCVARCVRCDKVDAIVLDKIQNKALEPKSIDRLKAQVRKLCSKTTKPQPGRERSLTRQLADLDRQDHQGPRELHTG